MKQGNLFYNESLDRIDIAFEDGTFYDGLHCGECFEILKNNEWIQTRIEMSFPDQWYIVGCYGAGEIPSGLVVRI